LSGEDSVFAGENVAGRRSPSSSSSDLNRAWWDERVPLHTKSDFYDVDGFLGGATALRPFEPEELGDVAGLSLVHLQCHFGLDTLSWARLGANVTGLDFSAPAMDAAAELTERAGLQADWVVSDVMRADEALGGRRFDVVYTGLGALNWLDDVQRWARVVAELVAPGGFLYLSEFHPFTWVFADDDLSIELDYFQREAFVFDDPGTYADLEAKTRHNSTEEWQHTLGDVVSAVIDAGLELELLHEHDYTLFPRWPFLEQHGAVYNQPAGRPRLPLMYSLRARRRQ
jgi:2-polyprenyl-3-methyl-5-hydroxy-6-metoxy-1,4-benzoquinol methylase